MIVFFDLETTGLNAHLDKIIQASFIKTDDDFNIIEEKSFMFSNEGTPISKNAFVKHGIDENELKDKPKFEEKAQEIYEFIKDCDLGGYNIISFDIPFLVEKFLSLENPIQFEFKNKKIYDSFKLYKKKYKASLENVYKLLTKKELEDAHNATADTKASIDVLKAELKEGITFDEEGEFSQLPFNNCVDIARNFIVVDKEDGKKDVIINFGKYVGSSINDIDNNYLSWICTSDFPITTKNVASFILNRRNGTML